MINQHRKILASRLLQFITARNSTDSDVAEVLAMFQRGATFPEVLAWVKAEHTSVIFSDNASPISFMPHEADPLAVRYFQSMTGLITSGRGS